MILFQLRISSRGNVPRPARLQTLLFQGQTHRINMLCLRGCAKTCVGIPGPRGALLTWSHCPPVRTTAVRKITLRSRNSAMFLTTKPGSAPRAFLQLAGAQPWSGALRTQLPPPPPTAAETFRAAPVSSGQGDQQQHLPSFGHCKALCQRRS